MFCTSRTALTFRTLCRCIHHQVFTLRALCTLRRLRMAQTLCHCMHTLFFLVRSALFVRSARSVHNKKSSSRCVHSERFERSLHSATPCTFYASACSVRSQRCVRSARYKRSARYVRSARVARSAAPYTFYAPYAQYVPRALCSSCAAHFVTLN